MIDQKKSTEAARSVAEELGVGKPSIIRIASNGVYQAKDLVIRVSPREDGENYIRQQMDLALFLADRGFKTSRPYLDKVFKEEDFLISIWSFVKGETDGRAIHDYKIGQLLYQFHKTTDSYKGLLPNKEKSIGAFIRDSEKFSNNRNLTDKDISILEKRALEFEQAAKGVIEKSETGVIHGDFSQSNIISQGGVAYLIDLDRVCIGPRQWDLAHPIHSEIFFGSGAAKDVLQGYGARPDQDLVQVAYFKAVLTMSWFCSQKDSFWKQEETKRRMEFWKDPKSRWPRWRSAPMR